MNLLSLSAARGSGNTIKKYGIITKTFLVMKLTTIFLLAAVIQVSAKSRAQTVTYEANKAPLATVFAEIKKQTGYIFFYRDADVAKSKPVTVSLKGADLKTSLELILKDQSLVFTIKKNTVLISGKPDEKSKPKRITYLLETPPVKGRITDINGNPLAGVNIMVKGSAKGTITDNYGNFSIDVLENATLIISAIGYESQEIKSTGETIAVQLKMADNKLDEVVFKGYYNEKKRVSTGSVSKVTQQEIEKQPVSNPLQAISGRMAGVYVTEGSGMPGGIMTVQIRGQNSLRNTIQDNGNLPLYVIDGVPFASGSLNSPFMSFNQGSPLAGINPSDIEKIEVLKDADATSIYGSRGANGVVLITTKKGKAGKTTMNANIQYGISEVAKKVDLLNTEQYLQMRTEGYANNGVTNIPNNFRTYDIKRWSQTRYTDWQDVLIGNTANQFNAQVGVSGGSASTQFLLSGGFFRQTYVFPGDASFNKKSALLNVNHVSEDQKFQARISVNYVSSTNDLNVDYTSTALTLAPNAPALYGEDGKLNWEQSTFNNPLGSLQKKNQNTSDNLVASTYLSYELITGLKIKANLGYNFSQTKELSTSPISANDPANAPYITGSSVFGQQSLKTWLAEPQLEYSKYIGGGTLSVLLGSTFQQSLAEGQTIEGTGYTSDALIENILAAEDTRVIGANYSRYRYVAGFSRVNYNYLDKYLINLTVRRDGSSRFGENHQFGNFGSVGAAWVFSKENFFKSNFLSFGKIRFSYGSTGSDAVQNYQYLNTYSPTTFPYNGSNGLALTRLSNPDFSWESTRKMEAVLDLGFLNDKLLVSLAGYRNRSSNQLVGLPLPVITGESSVTYNFPATVQNSGLEIEISSSNIKNRDFQWQTSVNITFPKNKLVGFPDIETFPAYNNKYKVGESIFMKKTLQYTGVDPVSGVYTFKDLNNDGAYSVADDGLFLKEIAQKYYGGINNSLSYKGFQLDFLFQFVKQTGNAYLAAFSLWPGAQSNQPVEVAERWQKPGDITGVQQYSAVFSGAASAYTSFKESDAAIEDASFIRLKNVSLAWSFPSNWINKAKIQSAQIYFRAQNLLTFTKYKGLDPENQNVSVLPPLRMMTAGVNLNF